MPLALPPLLTFERYELEARGELLVGSGRVVRRSLDGQTFLELTRLDLQDAEAICAFANSHGLLRVGPGADWMFTWLPPFLQFDDRRPPPDFRDTELYEHVFARRERSRQPAWLIGESLEEFRFGANCLADLTQAWLFLTGELDRRSIRSRLPLIFPQWQKWRGLLLSGRRGATLEVTGEITVEAAEQMLSSGLTVALSEFAPRLLRPDDDPWAAARLPDDRRGVTGWQRLDQPNSSLYLLCCLELFNVIARDATWRECAREGCARPVFLDPKVGRRRGTIYCSRTCKNTQWRRDDRQRKRTSP